MNLKCYSALLVLIVSCTSFIAAHGHSHDGVHHHSHDDFDDVKPSFKYSKQANDQVKKPDSNHGHDCHGHSHGGDDDHHHHQHHEEVPRSQKQTAKEPSAG